MKKIILLFIGSFISVSASALTLEECSFKSDQQIAEEFLLSVGYGAQNGSGSSECYEEAAKLNVMISNFEYEGIQNTIVERPASLRIVNIIAPKDCDDLNSQECESNDDGMTTAIYEVKDSKQTLRGTFKFYRTRFLLNAESINEVKCGMMAVEPVQSFMFDFCR